MSSSKLGPFSGRFSGRSGSGNGSGSSQKLHPTKRRSIFESEAHLPTDATAAGLAGGDGDAHAAAHAAAVAEGKRLRYREAVVRAKEAIHHRPVMEFFSERNFKMYTLVHRSAYRLLYIALCVGLLSLAFWERPSSFRDYGALQGTRFRGLIGAELAMLLAFSADVYLWRAHLGERSFYRSGWLVTKLVVVCVSLTSVVLSLATARDGDEGGPGGGGAADAGVGALGILRLHRLARPLLLVAHLRNARAVATGMFRSVPGISKGAY